MQVLAIDPGTKCGWALFSDGKRVASGVWDLKSKRHEGAGMRFLRMRRYFLEALEGCDAVAYEEVRRHAGTSAAHVYGGIIAVIQSSCEERGVPYQGIPVGTVKKRATGKGNAGKPAMIAAAVAEGWAPADDNEADALWIGVCLMESL